MTQPSTQAAPSALRVLLGPARLAIAELVAMWVLLRRTLYFLVRGNREKGAIVAEMYSIGNRSIFFMTVTMGFIGAIIVFQSGTQAKKLIPDMSMLGAMYIKLLVRDLAASVGAMPLATRVGSGIAAEIGSMVVTEQVDALRMNAADPADYLVAPKLVASVIMGTVVLLWAGAVALVVGMITADVVFDVRYQTFLNLSMVNPADAVLGLIKCVAYGGAIALVSAHCGLRTFGGSEGVGWATTHAVVGSCFAIIVLNLIISAAGHFLLPA
jgi:phospholipid/cholesterol/gamma-HCH transport system permease protein